MSRIEPVSKSKYRAVISEVLPFERPAFFSNRFFARFLKHYGVVAQNGRLVATKHAHEEGLDDFLRLLGGEKGDKRPCFQYRIISGYKTENTSVKDKERTLSVIHPYHQVMMAEFYERYASLLLNFCKRSSCSIRYPYRIATFQLMERNHPQLFTDVRQKEFDTTDRMKHYFAYRHYDNISEFYDSHRFLRAEKRFRFMTKMDLKNCFENIYPEDLSKALFDMPMEQAVGSLAEAFCQLQRDFTENEKGIVIGPEFSRIYAEMIMQKVEIGLEKELLAKGLALHKDYQYYRYVDDVFLFYNDDETGKAFKQVYEKELGKFHQTINEDKLVTFTERPFVEPMAVVKAQFRQLVNEIFENRLDTFKGFVHAQQGQYDLPMSVDYKTFINKVRVLIAASRHEGKTVTYDKLTPFLLSCIQTHLEKLLIDFNSLYREYSMADKEQEINAVGETTFNKYKEGFVEFACELTRIIFFLLASDFRMNTSKRAMATINRLQLYVKGMYYFESLNEYSSKFPVTYISRLDHLISDETAGLLKSTSSGNMHSMEMLNLLELQKSMSQSDRISARTLSNYLAGNGKPENAVVLNFFTAMELLHFAENNPAYHEISKRGFEWMERKTEELQMPGKSDTESVLALLEILCCPWVKDEIKGKWSRKLCSQRAEGLVHFANSQKELFVKWRDYRLQEELQHTNSSEVY